jgi:hypothetical protein
LLLLLLLSALATPADAAAKTTAKSALANDLVPMRRNCRNLW